jgi:hypothetical protein
MVPGGQVPVLLRGIGLYPSHHIETSVLLAEKAWLDRS